LDQTTLHFPDFDFAGGEVLLIDKPYTWTSFDVVNKIRNTLKPQKLKVGHAGTLDPLATGLLVICTGKLTKQIDMFQAEEKEYTGTLVLGATTPSFDLETAIDSEAPYAHLKAEDIDAATAAFQGEIEQYPPAHSAVKVNGERLYVKARLGEEVALKKRQVTISTFAITRVALPEVDFRVVCSKGTYIRSLVSDFGKALGCGAYLSRLTRTRSGAFLLENAFELSAFIRHLRQQKKEDTDHFQHGTPQK